jgi:hypothetical protein
MSSPSRAFGALARETAICAGQLLHDRTTAGARGRIRGWRTARGLALREPPEEALTHLTRGRAISLRSREHDA